MARRINQTFRNLPELQDELEKLLADIAGKGKKAAWRSRKCCEMLPSRFAPNSPASPFNV